MKKAVNTTGLVSDLMLDEAYSNYTHIVKSLPGVMNVVKGYGDSEEKDRACRMVEKIKHDIENSTCLVKMNRSGKQNLLSLERMHVVLETRVLIMLFGDLGKMVEELEELSAGMIDADK